MIRTKFAHSTTVKTLEEFLKNPADDVYIVDERIHVTKCGHNGCCLQYMTLEDAGKRGKFCNYYTFMTPRYYGTMSRYLREAWIATYRCDNLKAAEKAVYKRSDPAFFQMLMKNSGVQFNTGKVRSYHTFAPWMPRGTECPRKCDNLAFARVMASAALDLATGGGNVSDVRTMVRTGYFNGVPFYEDVDISLETLGQIVAAALEPMCFLHPVIEKSGRHKFGIRIEDIPDNAEYLVVITYN